MSKSKILLATQDNDMGDYAEDILTSYGLDYTRYKDKILEFPNYDIGIGFLYPYKIPKDQINTHTWINFHPGPLPEYGGRNIAYQAIMDGSQKFGATIHYMDNGFDTGDIIETVYYDIKEDDTAGDLVDKTNRILLKLLDKYIVDVSLSRKLARKKQVATNYYRASRIDDFIEVDESVRRKIRALTVIGKFCPKIKIGERTFIIKDINDV